MLAIEYHFVPGLLAMYLAANVLLVVTLFLAADPMTGSWKADFNDSVLPAGFPKLLSQTMVLQLGSGKLRCSTERVSLEGKKTRADFTAAFDGKRYPVTGMQEISTVSLRRYRTFIEADFFSARTPVFSYRMSMSSKDDTLIIISIDPVTRATLHARIVYRRESTAMILPPPQGAASLIKPTSASAAPRLGASAQLHPRSVKSWSMLASNR